MQVLPYSFIYFFYTIYFYLFFISYLEVYRNYILCIEALKPLSCKAFERIPSVHICIQLHPNPTFDVAFSGDFGSEDEQRLWLFACVSLFSANFRCSGYRLYDGNYTRSDDESPPFHIRLKGASRSQHAPLADRPRRRKWRIPLPPALWLLATHDLFSFQGS